MAKQIPEGIDSMAILNSIRPDTPLPMQPSVEEVESVEPERQIPSPRLRPAKRRHREVVISEFEQRFIHRVDVSARSGKLVYIRQEYHDRINKIIRVIGKGQVSIFEYVDNILTDHFERLEDQIKKLYRENLEEVY